MKKTSLICGVLMFVLVGCGQKGPLYLPQSAKPSPDAPKTAPVPVPATPSKQEPKSESTGN